LSGRSRVRGAGIDSNLCPIKMLQVIAQDVIDRLADLGRRLEDVRKIAVGENTPPRAHDLVELLGDAHTEPLHAPSETVLIVGLDDQMDVIALDREVRDAHAEAVAGGPERLFDAFEAAFGSEIPDVPAHPPIHVDGELSQSLPFQVCGPGLL